MRRVNASKVRFRTLPWQGRGHCLGLLCVFKIRKPPPPLHLHYQLHWFLVRYDLLAFLTLFAFLLLHRLVTCRPFFIKLSLSGRCCLLLSFLLHIRPITLLVIGLTLPCLGYVQPWPLFVLFLQPFLLFDHFYFAFQIFAFITFSFCLILAHCDSLLDIS